MSRPTIRAAASPFPSMLLALGATAVLFAPTLLFNPEEMSHIPGYAVAIWFVLIAVSAPTAAGLANRRKPAATTMARALVIGAPQWPLVVGLVYLDVWIDVQSGYLMAGSGEEAMAFGIGVIIAAVPGLILTGAVTVTAFAAASTAPPGIAHPVAGPEEPT